MIFKQIDSKTMKLLKNYRGKGLDKFLGYKELGYGQEYCLTCSPSDIFLYKFEPNGIRTAIKGVDDDGVEYITLMNIMSDYIYSHIIKKEFNGEVKLDRKLSDVLSASFSPLPLETKFYEEVVNAEKYTELAEAGFKTFGPLCEYQGYSLFDEKQFVNAALKNNSIYTVVTNDDSNDYCSVEMHGVYIPEVIESVVLDNLPKTVINIYKTLRSKDTLTKYLKSYGYEPVNEIIYKDEEIQVEYELAN